MLYGLDLFNGIGGITLALKQWVRPVAYCEIDPYCQSVLLQRMQEGHLPKAPIWDDIRTLSTNELPRVDIIYGGFPCQDISIAGRKAGLGGERSGLFFEILRLLDETQAPFVFLENVPNIRLIGAERVCKELSERGYDCRWCNLSASDVGARHRRERWFLLAHSRCSPERRKNKSEWASIYPTRCSENMANSQRERQQERGLPLRQEKTQPPFNVCCEYGTVYDWQEAVANVCRTVDELPHRVDRIKALGNSVVPLQVKAAFKLLMGL